VSIFYDPLISKLVAWGTDRAQAIARLKRALREYRVAGIRTTVPFFRWILGQPAFHTWGFHTGYLDELLHSQQGTPFSEPEAAEEDVAAIVAALHLTARAAGGRAGRAVGVTPSPRSWTSESVAPARTSGERWKSQARLEALRA
jgi:acetyl/propionyl-CoA carboxylase alpha subunit